MVHTVDYGPICVFAGGRDQHTFGAILQVQRRFIARGEDAGAFISNVNAFPRQLFGVADRGQFDRLIAHFDHVALDSDLCIQATMDRVKPQQMRQSLCRSQIVDGHNIHVTHIIFNDCSQYISANPTKAIDGDIQGHRIFSGFVAALSIYGEYARRSVLAVTNLRNRYR